MPRYAFRINALGRATDLRFVPQGYVLLVGEIEGEADALPTVDGLSNVQLKVIIQFTDFIMRFTRAEYTDLMRKRAAAVTAGGAGMDFVQLWDASAARGTVDLNNPLALTFKAALVTVAVLTQQRADVVFNGG